MPNDALIKAWQLPFDIILAAKRLWCFNFWAQVSQLIQLAAVGSLNYTKKGMFKLLPLYHGSFICAYTWCRAVKSLQITSLKWCHVMWQMWCAWSHLFVLRRGAWPAWLDKEKSAVYSDARSNDRTELKEKTSHTLTDKVQYRSCSLWSMGTSKNQHKSYIMLDCIFRTCTTISCCIILHYLMIIPLVPLFSLH